MHNYHLTDGLQGNYNIDREASEPDPYVVDLNTEISKYDELVSAAMLRNEHR